MRELNVKEIQEAVKKLCMEANYYIPDDVMMALRKGVEEEESAVARATLNILIENNELAAKEEMPICQDTGLAVIFVELGQDVHLVGGDLYDAINEGVRQGYKEGYLRKSTCHPFTRKNMGDNTPAIVHLSIVPGDKVKITVAPKGGGSENMSALRMMKPAEGLEGIKKFVIETVEKAGPNPCPPVVVGVGIGGNFEMCALLAKKALLRPIGKPNPDVELASLEQELLREINNLGIGPQGYGGRVTALAVHVEMMPCHIASLPVAVNINCHAARHKEIVL